MTSLRCRRNLTPVSIVCEAASISQQTQQITGNVFRISLQPDWQIDNGIFKWEINVRTEILCTGGGPEEGFLCHFADRLNQELSFVCGAD